MRHQLRVPLLSKPADQRKALLRGLTTQLIREGRVTTTRARAKALRNEAESEGYSSPNDPGFPKRAEYLEALDKIKEILACPFILLGKFLLGISRYLVWIQLNLCIALLEVLLVLI